MLHTDPNPFERETDLLEQPQVREEVIIIFEASEYLAKGKWSKALEKIDSTETINCRVSIIGKFKKPTN